jgi:hypothetical protein
MNPTTLHQMARRYLRRRHDELTAAYGKLPKAGQASGGYHYSSRERRVYPRYHVVAAILEQIERLDPDRLPELPELTQALLAAAWQAQSIFPEGLAGVEATVTHDERTRIADNVRGWIEQPSDITNLHEPPLGYRRVLAEAESVDWRERLEQRWGVTELRWHPMLGGPVPHGVVILPESLMWDDKVVARLHRTLRSLGARRVVELREFRDFGGDCLLDLPLFAPRYNGAEGMWTDESLDWLAYASHEGTVAFGGTLAERIATQPWAASQSR